MPADLEDDVPAGKAAEGAHALPVEGGLLGEGRAERHQDDLLRVGGPLPVALVGAVALAGADEGVDALVHPVGVRLERLRDQHQGARGAAGEVVRVLGDPVLGQPGREPGVVRPSALRLPRPGPHRLGDLLLVALPGDEVRGERDRRDAPAVGEDTGRVGGDVVQHEVGGVVGVGLDELRERLDGVVQERLHVVQQGGPPGLGVGVRARQGGGVGHGPGPGGGHLVGEGRGDGIADPVPPGDEFTDHLQAGVHVAVGGDGEHGDVGGCGHVRKARRDETSRSIEFPARPGGGFRAGPGPVEAGGHAQRW